MIPADARSQQVCQVVNQHIVDDVGSRWSDPEDLRSSKREEPKLTPLPKLQLSVLLYMQLAEPITAHVMLPFIVQLVEETGITGGDVTKVGYYTGLVESLFFFAEALTILQWGRLSDRIGRRPVLLTGLFGLALSMLCFGLSHTFWAVVASRALAGALNGNTGVIKSMLGEITDETNVAQAFAISPLIWSTGNTIAPLIGGLLQHPYERLGGVFRYSEFWRKNPYFLPCVIAALVSTSAFLLGYFHLEETAPCRIGGGKGTKQYSRLENDLAVSNTPITASERSPLILTSRPSPPPLATLLTHRVLVVILNYALLAITDVSFCVLQPLILSTPILHGGLGMSPSLIGTCLAGFGIANGTVSTLFFAPLTRKFGTKYLAMASVFSIVGSYLLFPLMNALARIDGRLSPAVWLVLMVQLMLGTLPPMGFSCIFIYLTSAAPSRSALGATNGLAQTVTSIMRSFGPAGATALFALSIERNILGGGLVYVVLCIVTVFAGMATMLLPVKPWARNHA